MLFGRKKAFGVVLLVLAVSASANLNRLVAYQHRFHYKPDSDTLSMHGRSGELRYRPKMNISVYPVQMSVNRRSVRIYSDHNQILPIYRHNGSFYMVMRLNKGVNWLNGLPRGKYFINNKPIVIK